MSSQPVHPVTQHRDTAPVVTAPDGSEIRELLASSRASMVLCALPEGQVSRAVRHRTVEEFWYFVRGHGQVWRRFPTGAEVVTDVFPGLALHIPTGCHFQFRSTGPGPLEFIIVTVPPWPGASEAQRVSDHWPVPGTTGGG